MYSVDLSTGYFLEATSSPFTAPGFGLPIAFSLQLPLIQLTLTVN